MALVYDLKDTEGDAPLPKDVADAFRATGPMTVSRIMGFVAPLGRLGVELKCLAFGDGMVGHVETLRRSEIAKKKSAYQVRLNANHSLNVQFVSLVHELGYLCLGHVGFDKYLKIPKCAPLARGQKEIDADSVAYIVCGRNGVQSESGGYLADYVNADTTVDNLDLYAILRAAGQVETALGLSAHISFKST